MLIIVAVGAVVVIGLLGYTTAVLRAGGEDGDALKELYAAEAGIAEVKNRLLIGDAIPLPWAPTSFEIDGFTVETFVTNPIRPVETTTTNFIDGNAGAVSKENPYRLTIDQVAPNSPLALHWAYSPTSTASSITVYEGRQAREQDIVTSTRALASPNDLPPLELDGGTYTFEFATTAEFDVHSVPFTDIGDSASSRFWVSAHRDYVVTSKAGDTTITAYLRQFPGPTIPPVPQKVYTLSWKPYE